MIIDPAIQQISSAEMTAYWRTIDPAISNDRLSLLLATQEGIEKAKLCEQKINYPLIGRAISVRAGYFLKQAVTMLKTGRYDACISFASGFSLLSSYIKKAVGNEAIQFYDTDLENMVALRKSRLDLLEPVLASNGIERVAVLPADLEKWGEQKNYFSQLFPNVQRPLILLEGIVYFITSETLNALFDDIFHYQAASIILDYFPEDAVEKSQCFARMYYEMGDFMPEVIKSLLKEKTIAKKNDFQVINNSPLQVMETDFCKAVRLPIKLINQDEFFPVKLMTLAKC